MVASTALEVGGVGASRADDRDASVRLLEALADPVRWQVLRMLDGGRRCVCELQEHVPVAPNLLSYHLRVLREAGLVTASRRGRWVDYELAPQAPARILEALPVEVGVGS